jgi:hypothetical protein
LSLAPWVTWRSPEPSSDKASARSHVGCREGAFGSGQAFVPTYEALAAVVGVSANPPRTEGRIDPHSLGKPA